MSMTRYLAVVPAYNEAATVGRVVRSIREALPFFDVLVVNDGSTDATADEATQAGAYVVSHPYNLGIGGAVQSGFIYALENDYDYLIQVDGDGQHDLDPSRISYSGQSFGANYGTVFLAVEPSVRAGVLTVAGDPLAMPEGPPRKTKAAPSSVSPAS